MDKEVKIKLDLLINSVSEGSVPLPYADLTKPFVYWRELGVFYVPHGHHQVMMALLLTYHFEKPNPFELSKERNMKFPSDMADYWLENLPGTAFKSSQSQKIYVGRVENLSYFERRFFNDVVEIFK